MKIKANFTLIPFDSGGRRNPVSVGYRPDWYCKSYCLGCGSIVTMSDSPLKPGAVTEITIIPLNDLSWRSELSIGTLIKAHEGSKLVGIASITEVL